MYSIHLPEPWLSHLAPIALKNYSVTKVLQILKLRFNFSHRERSSLLQSRFIYIIDKINTWAPLQYVFNCIANSSQVISWIEEAMAHRWPKKLAYLQQCSFYISLNSWQITYFKIEAQLYAYFEFMHVNTSLKMSLQYS
jgi:hypothetical protein